MQSLYALLKLTLCLLLMALVFTPGQSQAQDVSVDRAIYDDDAVFNQLSGAAQTRLERVFGKKPIVGLPAQQLKEDKSVAENLNGRASILNELPQSMVNNAAADATSQDTQSETAIVLGTGNNIIAGFNDSGSFLGGASKFTGFSTSANSGTSWTDGGTLPTNVWGDAGDPILARSTLTGTIFLATLGFNDDDVMPIFRSNNNGASWLAPVNGAPTPTGTGSSHDKEWLAVDNFIGTGRGNAYMAWRNFGSTNPGILFTRSTDNGASWGPSGATLIASPGSYNVQGPFVTVGPDHSVYVVWYDQSAGAGTAPTIRIRRSTDQGVSWAAAVTIGTLRTRAVNGDFGLGFRSNAFPQAAINPVSGNLYVVYPDSAGNGFDRCNIYFRTSIDNGATWSAATTLTGFNDQFNPAIAIRPDGTGLSVTWYDRRSDGANYLIERWGVNASISGSTVTFGSSFRISGAFPPHYGRDSVIVSTYMGDYDQMTADNNYYYTTWGDNRDQSIGVPTRKNANVRFAKYPSGLYLDLAGYQISGGNGNGIVDVNECNELTLTVKNNTGASVTGVSATLTSLTSGASVFAATQTFPDMGIGGFSTNSTPFSISTERSFISGTPIDLRLVVSSSSGSQTIDFMVASNQYVFGTGAGAITAGTADIGNHGDDLMTAVSFPFPVQFYNKTYTTANVSSNGNIQFEGSSASFSHGCPLPATQFNTVIMPYFQDLLTNAVGDGIFTVVSGVTPNRIFNIEWRAHTFSGNLPVNFEARFYESIPNYVYFIYGTVVTGGDAAAVGVQFSTSYAAQFSCNTASLSNGFLVVASFPAPVSEGNGTCFPPTMAVTPGSLSFTVPQNGTSGNVVRVSNTAPVGNDDLDYSVGDYTGSLVLSSGRTMPVEVRRMMGIFTEKMEQEEARKEIKEKSVALPDLDQKVQNAQLRPEESAVGQKIPPLAGTQSTNPLAVAPYVETFESGNFDGWLNEGSNTTPQVVFGGAGEGNAAFQSGGIGGHFSSVRQDWSGGVQPSSVEFYVRPSTTTDNQGYVVITTGAPANTEVIWFFCDGAGKFYINGDLPSGDNTFVYAAGTWYRVEYRNINWTTKTFNYYVNGSLIKAGVSLRNAGSVANMDRMHLYNFTASPVLARWDGIRVGGAGGNNAWLTEPSTGGGIAAGNFAQVLVNVNATGLAPASYTGTLVVSGNDPANASLTVPVTLTVTPPVTPTEFAVVSNINDNTINIIDVPNNASYGPYLGGLIGAGNVSSVEVTPDHHTALIASFLEHRIYFADVTNPAVPAVLGNATFASMGNTEDVAITGDGKFGLTTGGNGATYVGVVNIATRTVVQELNISPRQAQAVAVAPNGTVLVADLNGGKVHVFTINSTTGILSDPAVAITVGGWPINIGISPDGQTALVANYLVSSVSVLRITGVGAVSLTGTIPNIRNPQTVVFRPDGVRAYVLQVFLPSVVGDSIATLQVVGPGNVTDTGLRSGVLSTADSYFGIDGMDIAYSGNWAYAGDRNIPSVGAVNLTTNLLGAALPAGSTPTGVAIRGQGGPAGTTFSTVLNVFDNCNTFGLAFGTGTGLTGGYDAGFDQFAPPAPPAGAFDARLRVTSPANDFLKDYRALNTGTKIWDVYYVAATGCGNVTLSWNIGQLPLTGSFRLMDAFGGIIVNIDMRSQSFYKDVLPLGHLQIVYSIDAPYTKTIAANWNLLGLPNVVANPYYLSVFPTATPGTLFGFNGSYFVTDTLRVSKGYWLRFAGASSQLIPGVFLNSTSNSMLSGWNMIAGPSCSVPLASVGDPGGIIVPGTLFEFNGTYILSSSIDRGKGYWLRTTAAGTITMSCGSTTGPMGKTVAQAPDVSQFPSLEIRDASQATQTLYTNIKLANPEEKLSFSMPPVSPVGSFDARFVGDYRASESDGGLVQIQASQFPVTVTCPVTPANSNVTFDVVEMIGNEVGKTYRLSAGASIEIQNTQVNMLRLMKTSAEVPAVFAVDQNYPNPFNPTTEIRYALPQDAFVTITVFNALGQTVKTLVAEQQKAGYYRSTWTADNNEGQKVGSGVYFYKVVAGSNGSTKKMLLLK